MTLRSFFGAHLYNQIVYPLLAASVVVGIVATVVAVYFLENLTDNWVTQVARSSTENMGHRLVESAEQLQREARLCVNDDELVRAIVAGDSKVVDSRIRAQGSTLELDALLVLDAAGRVVSATGLTGVSPGDTALGDVGGLLNGAAHNVIVHVGGRRAIAAFQPVLGDPGSRTLVACEYIDDGLLSELGVAEGRAFGIYGEDFKGLAYRVGKGFDRETTDGLESALIDTPPVVEKLFERARGDGTGTATLRIAGATHQAWIHRVSLPRSVHGDSSLYVIGIASRGETEQVGRTTRNLIAMWSVVAVVALVGLGGWVARRVSDPLVELSAGARNVAEGDYSVRVRVRGVNEVAELAETFNSMTDSLRDRSESLTKKVLELATLYEMSRSMGSTLDLDELLGSVLESALRIFDLDLGYVVLRDKESGALSLRTLRGEGGPSSDAAVRSSMSEWVIREGRPLIFNPDFNSGAGQVDRITGAKAALCVPLVSSDGTIGAITIGSSREDYRFASDDVRLLSTIANHVTIAIGNIELFSSLQEAYLATVRSLAAAVDAKDTYTRGHSDRVATYATMIAERMGLSHDQRIALEMAAYLHDIGKIGVSEHILLKPGRLDDAEMSEMRHHPLIGANILKPVAFPWAITPVVRHHHEAYDGSGYPAGLRGEEIPLLARILTVADSYEAMTADRPYRAGRDAAEAIIELRKCSGTQFDERIVEVFAEIIAELDSAGERLPIARHEEMAPDEARAIFGALVDGVFTSFRRLGGPKLAANVEAETDEFFLAEGMPFRVKRGRIAYTGEARSAEIELRQMRTALRRIDAILGRVSGVTLVDHFYADALDSFSARMRHLAEELDFFRAT